MYEIVMTIVLTTSRNPPRNDSDLLAHVVRVFHFPLSSLLQLRYTFTRLPYPSQRCLKTAAMYSPLFQSGRYCSFLHALKKGLYAWDS